MCATASGNHSWNCELQFDACFQVVILISSTEETGATKLCSMLLCEL